MLCVSIFCFSAFKTPLPGTFPVLSSSYAQSVSVLLSSPQFDGFSPQTRPCQCIQMTLFINNESACVPEYMRLRVSMFADQLFSSHDEEGEKLDFPLVLSRSLPPSRCLRRRRVINDLIDVELSYPKVPQLSTGSLSE